MRRSPALAGLLLAAAGSPALAAGQTLLLDIRSTPMHKWKRTKVRTAWTGGWNSATSCCSPAARPRGVRVIFSIHRGGTSYPHYHKTTDLPANMNNLGSSPTLGGHIVRMNVAALAEIAGLTDRIFADDLE